MLLIEPLPSGSLQLTASGAEFTGPMASNLDGSYTRPLRVTGPSPAVGVQFNGQDVIPPRPLVPLADLHYVDEVLGFDGGAIASANQHSDPQAVLGRLPGKPDDQFVALGAAGRLGVGIHESVIVAAADDDITVFVHPEADLRSYHVEAFDVPRRRWVSLGDSIGVTQGFGLRAAGLRATRGIRITDTSGRTRAADLSPLPAPGACIAAVGVRKIAEHRHHDGPFCWCIRLLRRLWEEAGG